MTSVPELFGAEPANIQWTIVRGDTSPLRIEFVQDDEVTPYVTEGWEYAASAYDFRGDIIDELEVNVGSGYAEINIPTELSEQWGAGYSRIVAELAFDLQVTIDGTTVWTPVIGTIKVLGDITGGSL
jgi:hypothetical protein